MNKFISFNTFSVKSKLGVQRYDEIEKRNSVRSL